MKIGIDARLVTYRRGMGNFVFNLLVALSKLPGNHDYVLYVDDPKAIKVVPADPRFQMKRLGPKFYPLLEQVVLPLQAARDKVRSLKSCILLSKVVWTESGKYGWSTMTRIATADTTGHWWTSSSELERKSCSGPRRARRVGPFGLDSGMGRFREREG